jgi:deoxyhypusine synthase
MDWMRKKSSTGQLGTIYRSYVPGITDGAVGSQLWLFTQEHRKFKLDIFKDQQELADIVFDAKKRAH